jgi:GNAT superfamily N-acetyltransferase
MMQFIYRLTKCPELCFGIFISATPSSEVAKAETWTTSKHVENGSERRLVLIAHAIGTKTVNDTVKDEDMDIPDDINHTTVPEVTNPFPDSPRKGHKEDGQTICLHSLAVLPQYQQKGVGRTLLRSYIQTMHEQQVADRVAIITYQELVELYKKFGFKNLGESKAKFGGGSWIDMVYDIS